MPEAVERQNQRRRRHTAGGMDPVDEARRKPSRPLVFRPQPDTLAARYELFAQKGWSMRRIDGIAAFSGVPAERRSKRPQHGE